MTIDLLFVYGTLRQGESNAGLLSGLGRYEGGATMRGILFRIVHYPGMIEGDAEVQGELFRLADPDASLPGLDRFEGSEYRRVEREFLRSDGTTGIAWVYLYAYPLDGRNRIESGDWLSESGR